MTVHDPALHLQNLSRAFAGSPDVQALANVSLSLREAEIFTLLGPPACGKTTLLRLIAGFEAPSAGRILLDGQPITHLPPHRRPISTVTSDAALFPHLDVAQNIAFGLRMQRAPRTEIARRVDEMQKLLGIEPLARHRPAGIPADQRCRVALARALAPRPAVLLLDDPFGALQARHRCRIGRDLKRLQEAARIPVLLATSDPGLALALSDRVAPMRGGRILQVGDPRQLYRHPASRFVAGLTGRANFLSADLDPSGRVRLRGHPVSASVPDGIPPGPVTVLVRPEHAVMSTGGAGAAARIRDIDYGGPDTLYRLILESGEHFTAMRQNGPGPEIPVGPDDLVRLTFADGAVHVLRD